MVYCFELNLSKPIAQDNSKALWDIHNDIVAYTSTGFCYSISDPTFMKTAHLSNHKVNVI